MDQFKISFCTVCMNRLHHLQQTLPVNIMDNEDYERIEFVLLDYNSGDDLEWYVKIHLQQHIQNGRLKYYRAPGPKYFQRSHSRNLAFKLAHGDILCNIDADNFTGNGFASYVNAAFQKNGDIFLNTQAWIGNESKKDTLGRICVMKKHFMAIRGFDECMEGYGFEDHDLANRLEQLGLRRTYIQKEMFLQAIPHTDAERISNEYIKQEFDQLLIKYIDPATSEILILLADHKCLRGILVENAVVDSMQPRVSSDVVHAGETYSLSGGKLMDGTWQKENADLVINDGDVTSLLRSADGVYVLEENKYHVARDPDLINQIVLFVNEATNKKKMTQNIAAKLLSVNNAGFGAGTVYMNFDDSKPIFIS